MTLNGRFSRRERQIMDILYRRGEASVGDVRDEMNEDAPSYSAVRALLGILEKKGHIRHQTNGSRFIYMPARARTEAAQSALAQLVKTFFGGSVEQVVASLVADPDGKLSSEELDRLARLIDDAREGDR
jgi:predicted transcriptional regulator